jgi:hypothetical protein
MRRQSRLSRPSRLHRRRVVQDFSPKSPTDLRDDIDELESEMKRFFRNKRSVPKKVSKKWPKQRRHRSRRIMKRRH